MSKNNRTTAGAGWALAGLLLMTSMGAVQAAERYAVMSLVGDKLTMVRFRPQVASNANRNDMQVFPTADAALDKDVLLAVDDELRRIDPQSNATLMSVRDVKLFALQESMTSDPDDSAPLFAALKDLLKKSTATRLVLVTKYRADARMRMSDGYVGTGKLSGLGFYIDEDMYVTDRSTGTDNQGYIAPYAYFTFSLIDIPSMTLIKRVVVPQAQVVPVAASKDALKPWDAMTSKQKLEGLEHMIRLAAKRALPDLLTGQ